MVQIVEPHNCFIYEEIITDDPQPPYNTIKYFTDGSKNTDGVGSAFCVFKDNLCIHTWKSKLKHFNTVFQAEAFVVYNVINWHLRNFSTEPFILFTDSLSVIKALQRTRQNNALLQNIIKLFLQFKNYKNCYGKISWIKAHVWNLGNELADSLAKEATSENFNGIISSLPISKPYIKVIVAKHILAEWQLS